MYHVSESYGLTLTKQVTKNGGTVGIQLLTGRCLALAQDLKWVSDAPTCFVLSSRGFLRITDRDSCRLHHSSEKYIPTPNAAAALDLVLDFWNSIRSTVIRGRLQEIRGQPACRIVISELYFLHRLAAIR